MPYDEDMYEGNPEMDGNEEMEGEMMMENEEEGMQEEQDLQEEELVPGMPADIDDNPMEGLVPDNTQKKMAEEVTGREEMPYPDQEDNVYVEEKQGAGHYYDSIQPDEFEMPDVF
jgi:hypothetical protein